MGLGAVRPHSAYTAAAGRAISSSQDMEGTVQHLKIIDDSLLGQRILKYLREIWGSVVAAYN